jgi:flavin-binding protein dodecin
MFRASSDQEAEMAPQGKKIGKSKDSWDDARKKAVDQVTEERVYTAVFKLHVKVESPGIVHEYIVELT